MNFFTEVLSIVLAAAGFGNLLSLLIRVTLIAATGTLLCFLFRKGSAAKRHLTAMATLIALIAFPAAKTYLPALPLPILPATPPVAVPKTEATLTAWTASTSTAVISQPSDGRAAESVGSTARNGSRDWLPGYAILTSLLVSSALLLHVLVSLIAAAITARRARRIDDAELRRELATACERLGVSSAVEIRESESVTVPVVWGLFRPVLLLPAGARGWSRERLRVVFLHEVAHVVRHDGVCLLLARVATSVFWFHPLVWHLARVARRECERCCDDLVLAAGERATDYATHLLAIVRSMARQDRFAGVAPALAQRSNLEGRLVSILRAGQCRDSVSRSRLAVTTGVAALLLAATTAVRVVAAPDPADGGNEPALIASECEPQDSGDIVKPMEQPKEESLPWPDIAREVRLANAEARKEREAAAQADQRTGTVEAAPPSGTVEAVPPAGALNVAVMPSPVYVLAGSSRDKGGSLNQSGIEYLRAGQYSRAITAFEEEIRQTESVNARYNLACAYALRGDKQRAFDALQKAIENGFGDTHHMAEDEDLRLLQGDPHFYQLVRLAKDLQLFESGRFGGMNDEQDWRRSLPRLERVTQEHPTIGRAWANLGFARLEAADPKGGMTAYQRALDLGYQKPKTLYNLACCAARSGALDEAFKYLDRADQAGFEIGEYVGTDSDLDALRGDPRYGAMLDRWDQKMAKQHRDEQSKEEKQKTD